jgi:hypothetical protein
MTAPASGAIGPLGHLSEPEQSTPAGLKRPRGQSPLGHLAGPGAEYPGGDETGPSDTSPDREQSIEAGFRRPRRNPTRV